MQEKIRYYVKSDKRSSSSGQGWGNFTKETTRSSVLRGVEGFAHQYDEPSCDDELDTQDEFSK